MKNNNTRLKTDEDGWFKPELSTCKSSVLVLHQILTKWIAATNVCNCDKLFEN